MAKQLIDATQEIRVLKRKMTHMEEKLDDLIESISNEKQRQ